MAASDYDGRLPEPPYDTDTSAVVALQEECDRLAEQVKLLREALEEGEQLLATHPEVGIGNSKVHFCYHKFRAALEATKEGA